MKKIKEYFSNKTGEQIFSLCLLIGVVALMLFCAIIRLCGALWFKANINIEEPSKVIQEIVKGALLIFELMFVYKILCRTSWGICFLISIIVCLVGILLGELVNNSTISSLYYLLCYILIPIIFVRHWFTLIESVILYVLQLLYSVLFLYGRIGGIDVESAYNFIYNVLGAIDYKLFIVSFYLLIKFFGGIKLWKKQKRLIFQTDLKTRKMV